MLWFTKITLFICLVTQDYVQNKPHKVHLVYQHKTIGLQKANVFMYIMVTFMHIIQGTVYS